jgi:oxygen-dependent protoporphyrinogen oxidase
VNSLVPSGDGWKLSVPGQEIRADRICLAAPAPEAARLVDSFAPEASSALREIPHAPLAVLHLASAAPRRLEGFGHLVVPQKDRRILGAIWSSALFPGRAPEGRALFTVYLGGARDPGALDLSDDALVGVASHDLAAVGLPRSPDLVSVTRYPAAIPQYEFGHGGRIEKLAETERRNSGLTFLGSYRGGVAVGDVVRSAVTLPG